MKITAGKSQIKSMALKVISEEVECWEAPDNGKDDNLELIESELAIGFIKGVCELANSLCGNMEDEEDYEEDEEDCEEDQWM